MHLLRAPRRRARGVALVSLALALGGCLDYSPHAIPLGDADTAVHRRSLERLLAEPAPEVLRFAVVGDAQASFDEAEQLVAALNRRDDLSFVVQVGDFTHVGTSPEYRAMNALFRELRAPYFVAVGNHDLLGNGGDVYDRMFGERYLAFSYAGTRVVLLDSNAVEYGFDGTTPDLERVRAMATADPDADHVVLVAHVDPSSEWDPALREPYYALVRELGVEVSFYGHGHEPHAFERDGSRFYLPGAVDRRTYLVTMVGEGGVEVERRWF